MKTKELFVFMGAVVFSVSVFAKMNKEKQIRDLALENIEALAVHWVWCIGRGPHLQLRQEPQGTSDFRVRSQGPCRLGTGESGLVLG